MPFVNVNIVDCKDTFHLSKNCGSSHLYTVGLQNCIDVIGVYFVVFQYTLVGTRSKLPHSTQIRSICCQLERVSVSTDGGIAE